MNGWMWTVLNMYIVVGTTVLCSWMFMNVLESVQIGVSLPTCTIDKHKINILSFGWPYVVIPEVTQKEIMNKTDSYETQNLWNWMTNLRFRGFDVRKRKIPFICNIIVRFTCSWKTFNEKSVNLVGLKVWNWKVLV